jgi:hypothetical protein
MPSDAELLGNPPLEWKYKTHTFHLAPCDLDMEKAFQTAHERWSFNRNIALKPWTSDDAYRELMELWIDRRDANEYAFGTATSLKWLLSEPGIFEYILLKFQRGQGLFHSPAMMRSDLEQIQKNERDVWVDLKLQVLRRDFPRTGDDDPNARTGEGVAASPPLETPTTPSSSQTAGRTPSTGESGPFSADRPGG